MLTGHQKKITGLTFSQSMNVLVSSGADAQVRILMLPNIILGLFIKMEVELNVSFVHVSIASTSIFHTSLILGRYFVHFPKKIKDGIFIARTTVF